MFGYKPMRMLSKLLINLNKMREEVRWRLLIGVAYSLGSAAGHTPILGAVLRAIKKSGDAKGIKPLKDTRLLNPYRFSGGIVLTPDWETYEQFSHLYGIPPGLLREIDNYLEDTLVLESFPIVFTDDRFREWFEIDVPVEAVSNVTLITDAFEKMVLEIDPALEEYHKVRDEKGHLRPFHDVIRISDMYGKSEEEFGAVGHVFLHRLFGSVSYINLRSGIALHRFYNRIAWNRGYKFCSKNSKGKSRQQLVHEINSLKGQVKSLQRKRNGGGAQAYARMISDPCSSDLVPGFWSTDEGVLSRIKTITSTSSAHTYGYFIWDPSYASEGSTHMNAFFFTSAAPGTAPVNTSADPLGAGPSAFSPEGLSWAVGAGNFNNSTTVADLRCVGACMRVTYFGRMDASAGRIGYLENLSVESFFNSTGNVASVNDLFALSSKVERLGVDTCEVVWRPTSYGRFFKNETAGFATVGTGAPTVHSSEGKRFGSGLMGFVFSGVTMNELNFEFYQNIEWRPNLDSGFVMSVPRQINEPSYYEKILRMLDENYPGWSTTMQGMGAKVVSNVVQMALTGVARRAGQRRGPRVIEL